MASINLVKCVWHLNNMVSGSLSGTGYVKSGSSASEVASCYYMCTGVKGSTTYYIGREKASGKLVDDWVGMKPQWSTKLSFGGDTHDASDSFSLVEAKTITDHTVSKSPSGSGIAKKHNAGTTQDYIFNYSGQAYYVNGSGSILAMAQSTALWKFVGWDGGSSTSDITMPAFGAAESHVAYFKAKFTIHFNANYGTGGSGSGEMSDQSFVDGESQNLSSNAFSKTGYWRFRGWNTRADGTGNHYNDGNDGKNILSDVGASAGDTVNLYAEWEYSAFNITVDKVNTAIGGQSVAEIGTLSLVRLSDNTTVATEDALTHVLYYEGTADGSRYRVVCAMDDAKPDMIWTANGIADDNVFSGNVFTPVKGNGLSRSFRFTKKTLCSMALVASPLDKGTCAITSPSEPDDDGKYVYGRNLVIVGTPSDGYGLTTAAGTSGARFNDISDNTIQYNGITQDETLTLYFTKVTYRASVAIDAASASAVTDVKIKNGSQPWSTTGTDEYQVGDILTLKATVASGYAFDGWYVDGVRVTLTPTGVAGEYEYSGTGTKTFVAKAKVAVSLSVVARHTEGANPETQPSVSTIGVDNGYVTLGQAFSYEVILRGWIFNAWFNTSDTQRTNPLTYGASGTITPTSAIDMTADVTSAVIQNTITVVLEDDDLVEGQTQHTDISQDGVISTAPVQDRGGWSSANTRYEFCFDGTKRVVLTSLPVIDDGNPLTTDDYSFVRFADNAHNTLSTGTDLEILTATKTIRVMYAKGGDRTVTLSYGTNAGVTGDVTMGSFAFSGVTDAQLSDDGRTASVSRGTVVGLVVTPKNGYKFSGWYTQQNCIGSAYSDGTNAQITVIANLTLYAKFDVDTNAVYVWEGSGDNKSLEWRSKTFVLARPANMNCCRVDTEGYPLLELDIDMFSAPNASPTATVKLTNVASQDARRLPVRRPERYLQVCVKNNREVDAVFVGTNMAEMAQ